MDLHFLKGKEKTTSSRLTLLLSRQATGYHQLLYFLIYVPEPSLETDILHSSSAEGDRAAAEEGPSCRQVVEVESQAVGSWC